MDEGGGSTNTEESLLVLSEGRISLAPPEVNDRNVTSSSGEESHMPYGLIELPMV